MSLVKVDRQNKLSNFLIFGKFSKLVIAFGKLSVFGFDFEMDSCPY